MDLAEMVGIGTAATAAVYMLVDSERRLRIDRITDHLIADSVYRRIDNRSLNLPEKESFRIAGFDTYRAVQRYNQVYDTLQEKGDTADPRELEKLFDVK